MLDVNQKQNVQYCVPLWVRDEQIRSNIKRIKGRIKPHDLRDDSIAIVGYGPSLNTTWQEVKNFKYVMTCSGAHRFLIDRGIIPTWHVDVDPREHKGLLIGEPHKDVEYLMASCIHPKVLDRLEGFNVKLWHVFAADNESDLIIPRGEWAVTGGCDAGMRCMTIARFMGFRDFHIFGVDGSSGETGSHAADHPNKAKTSMPVPYKGKTYQSTPALVECARQIFHELDQMPDVKVKFYGEGLIQHMSKHYERKPALNGAIAFNRPELISEEHRKLNADLHQTNAAYGVGGGKYAETVLKLTEQLKTQSVLDYGCGKGYLAKALPFPIWEYDPAIPEKANTPRPAALVICTDVLEHIEPDKLKFVLDDLKRCVQQVGYFVIHMGPAKKTYADGRNTHLIQQDQKWWKKQLSKFFDVGKLIEKGNELHCIVAPKTKQPDTTATAKVLEVKSNGIAARFNVVNDTTRWRVETLLSKEPATIDWINNMAKGEVLYDIGANVGGYSVWAGVQGVKVYAFEPESQNYAILVQNLMLNNIEANAYCLSLSDKFQVGSLYLSQSGAGGSCHSFNEELGPDLQPRKSIKQGSFGVRLDDVVGEDSLPHPDHIKIDVDGLEFRVLQGAERILKEGVKSLLVEVNTNLPEHQEMVRWLQGLGYEFDQSQVDASIRKEGPFKGVAEHVFYRRESLSVVTAPAELSIGGLEDRPCGCRFGEICRNCASDKNEFDEHMLITAIEDAKLIEKPFPHFVMQFNVPVEIPKKYKTIADVRPIKGYPERFVGTDFKNPSWNIKEALLKKFGLEDEGFKDEFLFIRDQPPYSIGPHTDSPQRVLSLIAYVGEGQDGTTLYRPKDPNFKCEGGPHHDRKLFRKVKTIPYKKNTAFVFLKTDNSFHGVEPIKSDREVLLYDIRRS